MAESIVAPSAGTSAKLNVPPSTPVTKAVAPSHVAVNSKEESSSINVVTSVVEVDGQASFVVYSILYVNP